MYSNNEGASAPPVSEMAIVDTFTKLIFALDQDYGDTEEAVIGAFREVDANVYRDSLQDMGEYLRNLGVREMTQLVNRVRDHLQDGSRPVPGPGSADIGRLRRPH